METKTNNRLANFFIISGIGAFYLSITYALLMSKISHADSIYYLFNSTILIASGFFYKEKNKKIFAILSCLLFVSVIGSLFINMNPGGHFESFFFFTVISGMSMFVTGGIILVPMFLISVFLSFKKAVKIIRDKNFV